MFSVLIVIMDLSKIVSESVQKKIFLIPYVAVVKVMLNF